MDAYRKGNILTKAKQAIHSSPMIQKLRIIIFIFWTLTIVSVGIFLSLHREYLDPGFLLDFFRWFGPWALFVYLIASFFRGLLFIPNTPLILVGTLFFPENPHIVYSISLCAVLFSGTMIYKFSDIMGFDEWFAEHEKNKTVLRAIEKYGFFAVAFWSFFLILPTDLICYVAGTVRMNYWKFISALALWEGIIIGIMVYGGGEILTKIGI
jgi:uncharacterized membrane protein YdjX (TVP38/TMEM64 family)